MTCVVVAFELEEQRQKDDTKGEGSTLRTRFRAFERINFRINLKFTGNLTSWFTVQSLSSLISRCLTVNMKFLEPRETRFFKLDWRQRREGTIAISTCVSFIDLNFQGYEENRDIQERTTSQNCSRNSGVQSRLSRQDLARVWISGKLRKTTSYRMLRKNCF